jgi:hypothetical protein
MSVVFVVLTLFVTQIHQSFELEKARLKKPKSFVPLFVPLSDQNNLDALCCCNCF